jgi:signal transduction histidine kinase
MAKDELKQQFDLTGHLSKIRWILLAGFGGMLLLMVLAGVGSLRSLKQLNQLSSEVTQRFTARNQALITVVVSFHTYADQMEQYLLSDALLSDASTASEITKRGAAVHGAISKYPQDRDSEERLLLVQIENGLTADERSFNDVLTSGGGSAERRQRGHTIVFEELMPTGMQILQLANALSELNSKRLDHQNHALALQFENLQIKLARMVLLTLVAGLLLSLVAAYYILRLEQYGRERYLALAQSREELERLSRRLVDAQEAERHSISRELHDEVGQSLGALLVDIGQLSRLLSSDDHLVLQEIARIKAAAESAVKSTRDMALLLRPPMLDDLGLVPALEWQARETSRRGDMEVDVQAAELTDDPPDQIKICIYRVVQEALQNAATHAHAKHAQVLLKREPHSIVVEISDDGAGFQPERTRGMGILGMEERVRQLGGTFFIQSARGKGTIVHAGLPLDALGSG